MTDVLCVGECMLELRHQDQRTLALGFAGDTYNTAVYLRRVSSMLGVAVDVGYSTGLGEDPYSDAMRAAWRDEGIRDRSVTIPGRVPGLYAIRTAPDGERSFTYWRGESAASRAFADAAYWGSLAGDLIHLSGITLQVASAAGRTAVLARLRELRAAGAVVSFDTNYRSAGWASPAAAGAAMSAACGEADIVLASHDDELAVHGAATPEEVVRRLASGGAPEVVLRAGADGAYVGSDGRIDHVAARTIASVVDTTAAGDAHAGAYLAARLAGDRPCAAAEIANSVAAVVIGHPGAVIPSEVPLRTGSSQSPSNSRA